MLPALSLVKLPTNGVTILIVEPEESCAPPTPAAGSVLKVLLGVTVLVPRSMQRTVVSADKARKAVLAPTPLVASAAKAFPATCRFIPADPRLLGEKGN